MNGKKQISEAARIAALETTHPTGDPRFADLDKVMEGYGYDPTALIQVLHAAQHLFGYLSAEVLQYVAQRLKLPISHIYGVVTFYHFFTMTPRGKHQILVCRGTACHVRGADAIMAALERALGIKEGQSTKDGLFSLHTARCIGACALAPAVSVDEDVYGKLDPGKVPDLVKNQFKKYA